MPRRDPRPVDEPALSRRALLRASAVLAGGAALAGPWQALFARAAEGQTLAAASQTSASPYGPLAPVADRVTGLPLLRLPPGFQYVTLSWAGDPMDDGAPTPDRFDGMAAFRAPNGLVRLVRNHERVGNSGSFAPPAATYDPVATGGCTVVDFEPLRGGRVRSFPALGGTLVNCAGGPTPWRSWITCEEIVLPAGFLGLQKNHGYAYEVPAFGAPSLQPLVGLGRFKHEAACVDPASGIVYETEDEGSAGFYRFLPNRSGDLAGGGVLQMLAVTGSARYDTRKGQTPGAWLDVQWVTIADPDPADATGAGSVHQQGLAAGGAIFARLEGIWFAGGSVFFAATSGGESGDGQIWEYVPASQKLRLAYESPGASILSGPDNLTVSPRGGIAICEDGSGTTRLHGLTRDGRLFPFAESQIVLSGQKNGFAGDFRGEEFCGACYDPYGRWLLFNVQTPGITFAVTGPWGRGAL